MAKTASDMSVAELVKALDSKKATLDRLVKQRDRLRRDLDRIEDRIAGIEGGKLGTTTRRKRVKRVRNPVSLSKTVLGLLKQNKKGLALKDIVAKVLATGYKTSSKNFSNVVYQCLYNEETIVHDDESGLYRLK